MGNLRPPEGKVPSPRPLPHVPCRAREGGGSRPPQGATRSLQLLLPCPGVLLGDRTCLAHVRREVRKLEPHLWVPALLPPTGRWLLLAGAAASASQGGAPAVGVVCRAWRGHVVDQGPAPCSGTCSFFVSRSPVPGQCTHLGASPDPLTPRQQAQAPSDGAGASVVVAAGEGRCGLVERPPEAARGWVRWPQANVRITFQHLMCSRTGSL